MSESILSIDNLTIEYIQNKRHIPAVRGVSLGLEKGKTLGLVGESGCGKSTLALSLLGLLPKEESRITSGQIKFQDNNLLELSQENLRKIRGKKIAMVFQDPFSSLNPVLTIRYQLEEVLIDIPDEEKNEKSISLLKQVQLDDPERILDSYPHQLSGGQRQRVLIAIALAQEPELLIADEPTTALDVTIQNDIMDLLGVLQKSQQMTMIFVTHNMGLVKNISDSLAVMYAGQIVEMGKTNDVLSSPKHPYTQGLLNCVPKLKASQEPIPVLEGQPPEPSDLPSGCPFHPRCSKVFDPCASDDPSGRRVDTNQVRCHLYES